MVRAAVAVKEADRAVGAARPGGPAAGGSAIPVHKFVVMAIDKNTGKVLWEQTAAEQRPHEGHHAQYGSFASNSPITDGETLYVNFGSRGMYAFDLEGNLKWKKDLGQLQMRLAFGEGIAPIIHGNHLVIQNDHEGESYIVVLDKRDGKEIWRAGREERSSWPQPIVVDHEGRKQLVTSSTRVRSYDLETGELIWEAGGLGGNAIPAVVNVDNEMVIAMTGWRDAQCAGHQARRLGRDLTDSTDYIAWSNQRGNSYTASPVLHDGILYFITDRGMVSAMDAKSGEPFYLQQRLPEVYSFKASPVAANGKLYLATEQGDVVVLKLGKTYEVLATNEMGDEMFVSSPVVVGGDLFLAQPGRTVLHQRRLIGPQPSARFRCAAQARAGRLPALPHRRHRVDKARAVFAQFRDGRCAQALEGFAVLRLDREVVEFLRVGLEVVQLFEVFDQRSDVLIAALAQHHVPRHRPVESPLAFRNHVRVGPVHSSGTRQQHGMRPVGVRVLEQRCQVVAVHLPGQLDAREAEERRDDVHAAHRRRADRALR